MNFIETEIIVGRQSPASRKLFIPFLPGKLGEESPKDPPFVGGDILNFASLAQQLIAERPLSLHLFGALPKNAQDACRTLANGQNPDASLEDLVLGGLNVIAEGPGLHNGKDERLLHGIKLRERTAKMLKSGSTDARLNRMLLEDAFPDLIASDTGEKPVILGSGRYAIVALACNHSDPMQADGFYAVKFLKEDRRSQTFSNIGRFRFFEELTNVMKLADEVEALPVVKYIGFGRFLTGWNSRKRRFKPNTYEETLENRYGQLLSNTAANNKSAFSKAPTDFRRELQGDFFVMELGLGTLDDVLFYNHPWREQEIHKNLPDIRPSKFISKLRSASTEQLSSFLNTLGEKGGAQFKDSIGTRQAASGFRILEAIHSADPLLRYWIILDMFRSIADAVAQLHSKPGGPSAGYLAHRDLKPGNFLIIGYEGTLELALTDLGFVSGVESILRGTDTMGMSAKEPGVLTPGSYMFRAPEQIEAGFEIHFVLDAADKQQIRLKTGPEVRAEVGDWIECDDLSTKASKLNMLQIVAETSSSSREQTVTLDREFEHTLDQLYYHGYLIKPSGQHSDIFALGSILYYIISGGKNPEKFYQKCLEPEYGQVSEAMSQVYDSCFYLASMLCLDYQHVLRDIHMECGKEASAPRLYADELKSEEKAEAGKPSRYILIV